MFHSVLVMLFFGISSQLLAQNTVGGEINLQDQNWNEDSVRSLEGEWRFIPNTFLTEDDIRSDGWRKRDVHPVKIPGALPVVSPNKGEPHPWGTLLLEIRNLHSSSDQFALRVRGDTAFHIYLLDMGKPEPWQSVLQVGVPGPTRAEAIPQIADKLGLLTLPQGGIDHGMLVVHISGFHYNSTSLWSTPQLGLRDKVERAYMLQILIDSFVCGMIFVMASYFFSLFLHQRENHGSLWLAIYTGLNVFRMLSTSGALSSFLFPEPSVFVYEMIRKFEVAGLPLMASVCATFTASSLGHHRFERYLKWNFYLALVPLFVIAALNAEVYVKFLPVILLYMIINIAFLLGVSIHGAIHRKPGSILLLVGMFLISFAGVYDMGVGLALYSSVFIAPFGIAALIFCQGQVIARLFSNAFRTAKRLSLNLKAEVDRQTLEIKAMNYKMESILNNIPQGILSVGAGGVVKSASRQCSTIIFGEPVGRNLKECLLENLRVSSDIKSQFWASLTSNIDEGLFNYEVNKDKFDLLHEVEYVFDSTRKFLEIQCSPLLNDRQTIEAFLITILDITERKAIEKERSEKQVELDIVIELIEAGARKCGQFFATGQTFLQEIEERFNLPESELSQLIIQKAFVNIHTIKGAARTLRFTKMTPVLHDLEEYYQSILKSGAAISKSRLLDDMAKAKDIFQLYFQLNRSKLGRTDDFSSITIERTFIEDHLEILSEIVSDNISLQDLQGKCQLHLVELSRKIYDQLDMVFEEYKAKADTIARDIGRAKPNYSFDIEPFYIKPELKITLDNCMIHLLRNALDHGIEPSAERLAKGKSASGTIFAKAWRDVDKLTIEFWDDGKGLPIGSLKRNGIANGNLTVDSSLEEVANTIFSSGVSTAEYTTEFSGRGVGMSAVRQFLTKLGGDIQIEVAEPKDESKEFYHFKLILTARL